MAVLTYNPTTADVDLVKLYRKVTTKLFSGFNFKCEEYDQMDHGKFEVDWSAREILIPLDLNEGVGVASIPEGGWEALPSSPTLEEATATWIQFNKRYTVTHISRYIDENQGVRPMVKRQFVHQGAKAIQAIAWQYGVYSYGFSTAVLAKVAGGTTTVPTLKDAYGVTGLASSGSAYDKAYLTRLFKVGDRVAVLNPTGPAIRGFATITDTDPTAPNVTFSGAVAGTVANDLLVLANSLLNDTASLDSTDYNKGVPGLLEVLTSAGLHGLTHDNWSPAYSDTAAGRFTGQKLTRAKDEIKNYGPDGAQLDQLVMDQAVKRDTAAQYQAMVRFDDPMALEIEADIKTKRVKIRSTRKVPPGMVAGYHKSAYKKMCLWEKAETPDGFMSGDKIQDRNAMAFMIDYPWYLIATSRKSFAYFLNQQGI